MWVVIPLIVATLAVAGVGILIELSRQIRVALLIILVLLSAATSYAAYEIEMTAERMHALVAGAISPEPNVNAAVVAEIRRIATARGYRFIIDVRRPDGMVILLEDPAANGRKSMIVLQKPDIGDVFAAVQTGGTADSLIAAQLAGRFEITTSNDEENGRDAVLIGVIVSRSIGRMMWGVQLDQSEGLSFTVQDSQSSGKKVNIPADDIRTLPHDTMAVFHAALAELVDNRLKSAL